MSSTDVRHPRDADGSVAIPLEHRVDGLCDLLRILFVDTTCVNPQPVRARYLCPDVLRKVLYLLEARCMFVSAIFYIEEGRFSIISLAPSPIGVMRSHSSESDDRRIR